MPIYEYQCQDCLATFDLRRSFSQANDPVDCPYCQSSAVTKLLSTFFALSVGDGGTTRTIGANTGCTTCASHACSTCGVGRS